MVHVSLVTSIHGHGRNPHRRYKHCEFFMVLSRYGAIVRTQLWNVMVPNQESKVRRYGTTVEVQ